MPYKKGDLKICWNKINYAFPILNDGLFSDCTNAEYEEIHQLIVSLDVQVRIRDLVLIHMEKYIRQHVAPSFWSKFSKVEEEVKGFQLFKSAVNDLYESVSSFSSMLRRLTLLNNSCTDNKSIYGEKDVVLGFKQLVRATLLSQLPLDFHVIINHFYKMSFNVFDNEYENSDMGEDVMCSGCWNEYSDCNCAYIVKVFHDTNRKLMELQLLERLAGQVLTNFIQMRIESHIQKLCTGTFDVSHISFLEKWLDTIVMSWLTRIYCAGSSKPPPDDKNIQNSITKFKQKLSYYLYHSYTRLRIDQLFNIIIEYPDSQPAVDDIKLCLEKTDLRSTLCKKLQTALETRLLHPGVNTPDILTAYVSTIRALRHLDPSGVILETVTKPVRNYLRNREDTVRSVVSSLTEEGAGSELAEELAKFAAETDGDADKDDWDDWNPDPVDADPKINSNDRRASDIISMLVNVYGSKELFVNEYRTLLADRLLAQSVINTEKEIRYLELLKLRFGESQLHFCEVMLKDISDSRRINSLIHQDSNFEELNKKFTSNAMILSAQFWPPFKDESLELPEEIKQHLEAYTKSFEALKGNRTLSWKPHLGNVNIEIEIGEKTLNLTVSPFNATLIMHFEKKPEWSLDELHQVMKVPITVLRRKITYWQSMGLISEKSPDHFVLVEGDGNKAQVSSNPVQEMICEDDETESAMASAHDQREGELQVFWSYIVGMLTNLDSLPLDRIHQMLKMFASQAPGTECSLQELRQFLDTKVRTHQLVLQGGMYKLPKT
ncbi:anaphase-promoting complex subunit 2 [Pectinophora gossypiella]|uniref:anaphase-promoting complex subunit 2 n=1 Tax=Pectinophora gossypiella TaxID=13191 RepID=UPI00214DF470|nr:anaphase-promoting complex subunit 2 [Pectinophora gossypiella]